MVETPGDLDFPARRAVAASVDRRAAAGSSKNRPLMQLDGLALNAVHLWAAPLDLSSAQLDGFRQILSPGELDRSARFHFEVHRSRYLAAHGWLRRILGGYLSVGPRELIFEEGPQGKPALAGATELQFNMAHSEDLALIGIGRRFQLGVDLERVRPLPDAAELVARFFCKRESEVFQRLSEPEKPGAFFNLWTRKEAWLKATGEGIAHLLGRVEVSFVPGEPARLLELPPGYAEGSAWSLYDIGVRPGFSAALAVAAEQVAPELHWANEITGVGL
jgi:4'-phosphopantetheinyl transferase